MKFKFLFYLLFSAILSNACAKKIIPDNDSLIEYTGRIDFSNQLAPRFSYSGISIRASFTGKNISAILNDERGENFYNVILDGKVIGVLQVDSGRKEYLLASELKDTIHEIELFKRTELSFGKTEFFGFLLDYGESLVPIRNKRDLFFEFIGNSITCGYGNEGENGGKFGASTENHYLTYAAITSRNFNAQHMAVSRSGIGIYRNWNGPREGNADCMTNLYTRIFLYDEAPLYSFEKQPDLVFINLGTNDFSTTGADSALYVNNYFRLIDTIQSKYSKPTIVCLLGSMMAGESLNTARRCIQFVVEQSNAKAKGKVNFFEMSAQTGDLGIGIDYHPTVAQHQKNAQELTEYVKDFIFSQEQNVRK